LSKEGPFPYFYRLLDGFLVSRELSSNCPATRQLRSSGKLSILNKVMSQKENGKVNLTEAKMENELENKKR
jgi:hypothetical protein